MTPKEMILRCYAEEQGDDGCFAICLDLNIYARADSFEEARNKLNTSIKDYLVEAFEGDSDHIQDLIPRRAPFYFFARYYWLCARASSHIAIRNMKAHFFTEHLPLRLA